MSPPLAELEQTGLLASVAALDPDQAGALYTRAELLETFGGQLQVKGAVRKEQLLEALASLSLEPSDLWQRLQVAIPGGIVEPRATDVVELLQLLFFGNRRQSLTDFILSDLGS